MVPVNPRTFKATVRSLRRALYRLRYGYVQVLELLRRHLPRRAGERVRGALGLGECDNLADVRLAGEHGHQAVYAGADARVRRSAVLERLQHVAKAPLRLLRPDAQHGEPLPRPPPPVYTYRPAEQLPAVAHQVVGVGAHTAGVAVHERDVLTPGGGERVGGGDPAPPPPAPPPPSRRGPSSPLWAPPGWSATISSMSPRPAPARRAISRACSTVKDLATGERVSSCGAASRGAPPR